MKPSQAAIEMIKNFEGFSEKAYKDPAGIWTIGYGTTGHVQPGMRITREYAEALLKDDLERTGRQVDNLVQVTLSQNQFDALCVFAYNVGTARLQHSELLRKLNAGDYDGTAEEFARWNHAGGKVLAGLTRCREAEARLFSEVTPVSA